LTQKLTIKSKLNIFAVQLNWICTSTPGWWLGVAVTRFIRSTKLLYARPS